ncbi:hypothetical protein CROQUDRAFT_675003 [Cronartium quercuum f. sp. fusiforme G11]|uniref:Uncharacterized protein n=1 Tax=Cronartium quercuum f. sp. fusiforme G11 TaxID=708437 RepID=A0A9P6T5S4_9BASI|nr:hypothetical protein CROQUDRAFT_675003 [Cronartium quercuum f. sp. fusiforme G11]
MSSNSNSSTNSGNNSDNSRSNSGLGAATYYGAVAIVIFVLVGLTIVSRVLYTRKARRLARQRSIEANSRDTEERVAMERRGEANGLPTYRESILPTSRNPILASTPLAESPVPPPRSASADTLPNNLTVMTAVIPTSVSEHQISPPAYRIPPPKYEDAAEDGDRANQIVEQAIDAEDHPAAFLDQMRMRHDSVVTLVVPSIHVQDVDQPVPACGQSSAGDQVSQPV